MSASKVGRDLRNQVLDILRRAGATDVDVCKTGGGHQAAYFRVKGKPISYYFPCTPRGGVRSCENTLALVKRLCRQAGSRTMTSDFTKRMQAERKAESKFTVGTEVAVVNHHWTRCIERKARVVRVHANGNFTITKHDGTPGVQQWRPSCDQARLAGKAQGFCHSEHLEVWTPEIDKELRLARRERLLEERRKKYIAFIEKLRGNELAAVLTAIRGALPRVPEEGDGVEVTQ